MEKMLYVNIEMRKDKLEELKKKTGEATTKEALIKAINHYINCFITEKEQKDVRKTSKRGGRTPMYLNLVRKYSGLKAGNTDSVGLLELDEHAENIVRSDRNEFYLLGDK